MRPIKDMPGFVKDDETGVIQNHNLTDLQRAKQAKQRVLDEIQKREELEQRLARLESVVDALSREHGDG